jgi:hypothetical protein
MACGERGSCRQHSRFLVAMRRVPALIEHQPLDRSSRKLGYSVDLRQGAVFIVPTLNEKCRYA